MTKKIIKKSDKKGIQKVTDKKSVFVPTQRMVLWFHTAVELGFTATILDVSKKSKISRKTWYEWTANREFVTWWDLQWKKYLALSRWKLDAIGMKRAQKDYSYWLKMMERAGNIQPENPGPMIAQQFNTNQFTSPDTMSEEEIDGFLNR